MASSASAQVFVGNNLVESYKASMNGDGLASWITPADHRTGAEALTPPKKNY